MRQVGAALGRTACLRSGIVPASMAPRPRKRWLLLPLGVAATTCVAELPGPPVCSSQADCDGPQACVYGRCRPASRPPVHLEAQRITLAAADWIGLSASDGPVRPPRAEQITLGDPRRGEDLLLLRFAAELPTDAQVERALLVLDALPRCARRPARVRVELQHVLSPWRSTTASWTQRPKLGLPMKATTFPVLPARPLRLDVTALLEGWRSHRNRYHGIGLSAVGSGPGMACYASGLGVGRAPRLEIYLAPPDRADAGIGADADAASRPRSPRSDAGPDGGGSGGAHHRRRTPAGDTST